MWKSIPLKFRVIAFAAACLIGPVTFLAILLAGIEAGLVSLLAFIFVFVVLYLYGFRRYL